MADNNSKKYEIDMCNGPLVGKILIFYVPLMLSGVLQLLFNAADIAVVGRFAGNESLAAVGSTGSLTNLIINLFMGLSVGANVLVARYYGAGQLKELKEMVQTAMATAVIGGVILIFVGFFVAKPALALMATPDDVIDHSVLYMRIYFVGMPFMMAYNFGSAVLRAVGDTRRPLYYLMIAGVVNVMLNLVFVILFSMGVAGVAAATVISQAISAVLVIRCLIRTDGAYKLELKGIRIMRDKLVRMFQIGIPAGLQGSLFSISFAGQNYGAMKYKRVGKVLLICEILVILVGLALGNAAYFFAGHILKIYSTDPEVISYGILRMSYICVTYFLCGMMDVIVGVLRGIGCSIMPMLVSLTGACLFRVIWIYTIFQQVRTLDCLYISYPISWLLTFCVHLICFIIVYRKLLRSSGSKEDAEENKA